MMILAYKVHPVDGLTLRVVWDYESVVVGCGDSAITAVSALGLLPSSDYRI